MTYPDATQGTTSFNAIEAQTAVFGTITGSSFDVVYDEESYVTGTSGTFGNIQATNSAVFKHVSWSGTTTGTHADISIADVLALNGSVITGTDATLKAMAGSTVSATQATLKEVVGSTITGSIATLKDVVGSQMSGSIATLKDIVGSQMSGSIATLKQMDGSIVTGSSVTTPLLTGSTQTGSIATIKEVVASTVTASSVTTPLVTGSVLSGSQATLTAVVGSNISGSTLALPVGGGLGGMTQVLLGTTGNAGATSAHAHTLAVTPTAVMLQPTGDSGTAPLTLIAKGTDNIWVTGLTSAVSFQALLVK